MFMLWQLAFYPFNFFNLFFQAKRVLQTLTETAHTLTYTQTRIPTQVGECRHRNNSLQLALVPLVNTRKTLETDKYGI